MSETVDEPQMEAAPQHTPPGSDTSQPSTIFSEPLPPLHTPHSKRKLILVVGLIAVTLDLCCLPITYYYALKFGTSLKLQDIFAIITGVYGLISFSHYGLRSLKLFREKTASRWRPVGWTKWGMLEFFQVNVLIAIALVEIELVIGTIPNTPIVRLCAMPSPTICYWFGFVLIYSAIATQMQWKLPFNMSSTPKGHTWRPALLALIEDCGGIEGQGGVVYRSNVMKRYEVSPIFRRMILVLTWGWGVGLIGIAIAATVIIMELSQDIGFGIGWGLPYAWGAVLVFFTMIFVKTQLRKERIHWANKSHGEGQAVA